MTFLRGSAKIVQNRKTEKTVRRRKRQRNAEQNGAEKTIYACPIFFRERRKHVSKALAGNFIIPHAIPGAPTTRKSRKRPSRRVIDHHENLWGYLIFEEEGGPAAGYGLLTTYWCNEEGGNVLLLDELYISPEFRHRGYAKRFMDWIEEKFKKRAVSMTLEVLTGNQRAISLYKEEGFDPDSDERDAEGHEFVYYSKKLARRAGQ